MTLEEAKQATVTGYVRPESCPMCRHSVSEANGDGSWVPWTVSDQANMDAMIASALKTLAAFDCQGCSP